MIDDSGVAVQDTESVGSTAAALATFDTGSETSLMWSPPGSTSSLQKETWEDPAERLLKWLANGE